MKQPTIPTPLKPAKLTEAMEKHIAQCERDDALHSYFNFGNRASAPARPLVAFDVETPSIGGPLWKWDCELTSWSWFTQHKGIAEWIASYLGFELRDVYQGRESYGGALVYISKHHRDVIQFILDNCTVTMHNSTFDLHRLEALGYRILRPGDYHDTQLMAYELNYSELSLAALAHLGGYSKAHADMTLEQFDDFARKVYSGQKLDKADREVLERNLSDTRATYFLHEALAEQLDADERVEAHYRYVSLPYTLMIREMERTGFYIDEPKLNALHNELSESLERLSVEIQNLCAEVKSGEPEGKVRPVASLERTSDRLEPLFCSVPQSDGKNVEIAHEVVSHRARKYDYENEYGEKIRIVEKTAKGQYFYDVYTPFNPNSTQHKLHLLESHGWQPDLSDKRTYTESGNICVDKTVLADIAADSTQPQMLRDTAQRFTEVSKLTKLLSGTLTPLKSLSEPYSEGVLRVQCRFNQMVTLTHRLSSSNPNLQNIPSRGELGKRIRELFIPKPGTSLVLGDDEQIEARILAAQLNLTMNDDRLAKTFADPDLDFHMENGIAWNLVQVALQLENPDKPKATIEAEAAAAVAQFRAGELTKKDFPLKNARDTEKTALYGSMYGAGPSKLGNGDMELGKLILSSMEEGMPALPKLKELVWKVCQRRAGFIYSMWGSRGYYPEILSPDSGDRSRAQRQAFNFTLQSTSASRMFTRMIIAWPTFKRLSGELAGAVHDEYLSYVPKPDARELTQRLSKVFSEPGCMPGCPVAFEFTEAKSWAEKG